MSAEHDFNLRPFQTEVFEQMLYGEKKRVIVQAPTSAGKTRAALAPLVHRLGYQLDPRFAPASFPLTCRYAVPTRTLANQFHRENEMLAARIDDVMPTRIVDNYNFMQRHAISIQTGEQSDDPQMEAALTFCTIDQLLASAIAIPYGLGGNLANINVGGIAGSYLVLDEFHLYPLGRGGKSAFGALTTLIKLLTLLKDTTPFVLMTATFSKTLLTQLSELLDAYIVPISANELKDINGERIRTFKRSSHEMTAKAILDRHQSCSMAICNTVARAQKLWQELKEEVEQSKRDIKVELLHSRFTDNRRYNIAHKVEKLLGPAPEDLSYGWKNGQHYGCDIIFVATQVVEVGLNISVETLHTEIAPASNIVQRAGRCARFEKQVGEVIVYQPPPEPGGKGKRASALPYDAELCDATWDALEEVDGKVVGFQEEQQLVDTIHEAGDRVMLEHYRSSHKEIFKMVVASFNTYNPGVASELIRDVMQVQVLIHDDPEDPINGIIEAPWQWQSFAIHPGSLAKWWKAIKEANLPDIEWICRKIETYTEGDPQEPDNKLKTKCKWVPITNASQILATTMVVVPRRLASYDDQIGFMLLDGQSAGGEYQSAKRKPKGGRSVDKSSVQQDYQGHISGLLAAYQSHIQHEICYIATCIEGAMHLPKGTIDHAMRLAIVCHDLGKLGQQWQQWARNWQPYVMKMLEKQYQLPDKTFLFAKTEYDYSRQQREWQKLVFPKRPHHACESVKLGRDLIGSSLGITKNEGKEKLPVLRAACAAIARHHTSQASEYSQIELAANAREVVDEMLRQANLQKAWSYDIARLKTRIDKNGDLSASAYRYLTRPDGEEENYSNVLETLLYFVLVRALRLADQQAGLFGPNS